VLAGVPVFEGQDAALIRGRDGDGGK
jgi:hypothetical protein